MEGRQRREKVLTNVWRKHVVSLGEYWMNKEITSCWAVFRIFGEHFGYECGFIRQASSNLEGIFPAFAA